MPSKKKYHLLILVPTALLLILTVWVFKGNTALMVREFAVSSDRIPESFSGFRIAQVSDLHNAEFDSGNEKLLKMLKETEPDIIVITGDFVDSRRTDIEISLHFAQEAVKIAPCYYVTGNHEGRISEYGKLKAGLESSGVIVLENEKLEIERSGNKVALIGIDDPSFVSDYMLSEEDVTNTLLQNLTDKTDTYTLLLSHRPELFDVYVKYGLDLVFSGHAHGGQFRLPFIGGLYAPHQGILPKYDSGLYTEGKTNMIVSRGIGNSLFPFRVNNRPEIVVAELQGIE